MAEWTCPADDAEQEELDAFAAFAQARGKGKRKGKGKQKGKKSPDAPAGSTREHKATGTIVFTEQQKAERRRRIAQVKSRTACSACGRVGHWQGDPECPKNTTKKGETGKGHEAHGYFVCVEDPDGVADAYVVQDTILDEQRLCECVRQAGSRTGCNGSARWLDCLGCSKRLATSGRRRGDGTGAALWVYFMTSVYTKLTGRTMMKAARRSRMHSLQAQYRASGPRIISNVILPSGRRQAGATSSCSIIFSRNLDTERVHAGEVSPCGSAAAGLGARSCCVGLE